jgi:DNA-directed RNA polymerase specialized sigma subunit
MPKNLLEPNFQTPYDNWLADPSKPNTGVMLKALNPVLDSAVRAYGGPSATSVTLRSRAKKLAVEALGSYDATKGPLKSHMMTRLQRLRRTAAQQRQIIRMPEQVALDQMQTEAAFKELEDSLGRPPSDIELADSTGLSVKRLAYIRGGSRPLATSTITRTTDEGGGYDPQVTPVVADDSVWIELVYDDLEETNQYILERLLGLHGHKPHKPGEIAKLLKISPAAVSHRMAQIQTKLDKRDDLGML